MCERESVCGVRLRESMCGVCSREKGGGERKREKVDDIIIEPQKLEVSIDVSINPKLPDRPSLLDKNLY